MQMFLRVIQSGVGIINFEFNLHFVFLNTKRSRKIVGKKVLRFLGEPASLFTLFDVFATEFYYEFVP